MSEEQLKNLNDKLDEILQALQNISKQMGESSNQIYNAILQLKNSKS